jgi:SAM-dependent methyltransferase
VRIVAGMADRVFEDPRLAALYDAFEAGRSDLQVYLAIARKLNARQVLDVGCGTGTFAILLAREGFEVTGLDPARASVDIARAKPHGGPVRWVVGNASALAGLEVDLATMTGNVAQAIVDPEAWEATLRSVYEVLGPDGYLVFETRDPAFRGWEEWTRERTRQQTSIVAAAVAVLCTQSLRRRRPTPVATNNAARPMSKPPPGQVVVAGLEMPAGQRPDQIRGPRQEADARKKEEGRQPAPHPGNHWRRRFGRRLAVGEHRFCY